MTERRLAPEDFNAADVRTLIAHAKALAAPEPDDYPEDGDKKEWQQWRDDYTAALKYVEGLA
jgi:hypothetical protein